MPLPASLTKLLSLVTSTATLVAVAACGVSSASSAVGAGDNAGFGAPEAETDGGYESDGATNAGSTAGDASAHRGNALCNAVATTCFPDEAPRVSQCGSASLAKDGGDAGADGATASLNDADPDASVPGTACRVVESPSASQGPECAPAGKGTDGAECLRPTDCSTGFECVGSPGQCRRYCCGGACGAAHFCDIQKGVASGNVPVCAPVRSCKLLAMSGCAEGETCAIVNDRDGTTSCVAVGPQTAGQDCEAAHCAGNHTCLGQPGARRCYELCDKSSASSTCRNGRDGKETCKGTAPLFKDPNIGVCQK